MALVNVDVSSVPDKEIPLSPGFRTLVIGQMEVQDSRMQEGKKEFLVTLRCDEDCPEKGKAVWDNIVIGDPRHAIRLRRLHLSAGVPIQTGTVDTDALVGKPVRVEIGSRVRKDNQEVVATVKNYLIPGDQNYATA